MRIAPDFKDKIKDLPWIIGIAPNAFSRTVAVRYFTNYSIVCFKNRGETSTIGSDVEVLCVEEKYPEIKIPKVNSKEILSIKEVQNYINSKENPSLLTYKPSEFVATIASDQGWKVLANDYSVKDSFENKKSFREMLINSGVEPVEGETMLFTELTLAKFHDLQAKYGQKVVFQIAEMTAGGGTGTAFVATDEEFDIFYKRIDEKRQRLTAIKHVNTTRYMSGFSTSIAGCVTRYGVLTGRIQTQIQDIGEVRTLAEGSGLFSGHDWSFRQYSDNMQNQARQMARKFGEYIGSTGYKGIFGLDLIADDIKDEVYPIECNPRYTDAFPIFSEMLMEKGLVPMDVFHILEHLGVDYEADITELSDLYNQPLYGSQIILETKTASWTKVDGDVKAGVYKIENDALTYVKPGYSYEHIIDANHVLLTEGVPFVGTVYKPGARVLRLVFKESILADKNTLTAKAKGVISQVYKAVNLREIEPQEFGNED